MTNVERKIEMLIENALLELEEAAHSNQTNLNKANPSNTPERNYLANQIKDQRKSRDFNRDKGVKNEGKKIDRDFQSLANRHDKIAKAISTTGEGIHELSSKNVRKDQNNLLKRAANKQG